MTDTNKEPESEQVRKVRLLRERTLHHARDEEGQLVNGDPEWLDADAPVPADLMEALDEAGLDRISYDPDVHYRDLQGNLAAHEVAEGEGIEEPEEPAVMVPGSLSDPFPDGGSVSEVEEWVARGAEEAGTRAQHALDVELAKGEAARSTLVSSLRKTLGLS